jgi:hypothetical protein
VFAAALVAAATVLYRPSLHVGLLADDFALAEWARAGALAPPSWPFFRPLQLLLWAGTLEIVSPARAAFALHALNVAFHALNAVLIAILAMRLSVPPGAAMLAAVLFVVYPSSTEAVIWPSAFADVLMTSFVLTAMICASRRDLDAKSGVVIAGLVGAAVLTKETAVATGLLFGILGLTPAKFRRAYLVAACIAFAVTAIYFLGRAAFGRIPPHPGVSATHVLRLVAQPFTTLVFPFHETVLGSTAGFGLAVAWLAVLFGVAVWTVWHRRPSSLGRHVSLVVLWVLASVAPTVGLFAVGSDLQGSRYVYLATCAWLSGIAALLLRGDGSGIERYARLGAGVFLVCVCIYATRRHQRPWRDAAQLRDVVVDVIAALPGHCRQVFVVAPPDNVRGAYVARNGLTEAVRQLRGRKVEFVHAPDDARPECRVDFSDLVSAPRPPAKPQAR